MSNTKEIKTANHVFVVNEFITYGQHREITNLYIQAGEKDQSISLISNDIDKKGFELVIVSMDGTKENIYDRVSAMPFTEAQEIAEYVKSVLNPKI